MKRVQPVEARGRTVTVTLARGQVTVSPRWWVRLARPKARAGRFPAFDASLAWHRPRVLGGWLLFDLSEPGDEEPEPEGYLVKYGRGQRREFDRLVKAGNWQEVQQR